LGRGCLLRRSSSGNEGRVSAEPSVAMAILARHSVCAKEAPLRGKPRGFLAKEGEHTRRGTEGRFAGIIRGIIRGNSGVIRINSGDMIEWHIVKGKNL